MELETTKSKVYIQIDDHARILRCEGQYTLPADLDGWTLIEEGPPCDRLNLAQSHYFEGGLYTMDGIPVYRWDGAQVLPRTEEEIEADRVPPLESVQAAKLAELSAICNAAITAGCDVILADGAAGHLSLTAEDQINLTNACAAVETGAEAYPYHLDGELCALYQAADILAMGRVATAHKLYHTTYYNHLAAWVRRCGTVEEVQTITYGAALPDDLAENMAAILAAAGGGAGAV